MSPLSHLLVSVAPQLSNDLQLSGHFSNVVLTGSSVWEHEKISSPLYNSVIAFINVFEFLYLHPSRLIELGLYQVIHHLVLDVAILYNLRFDPRDVLNLL